MAWKPRYFDIGVNFSDQMFQGCYNGSTTPKHPADIAKVIARARLFNVNRMLITASTVEESQSHFSLVEANKPHFGSTVGVHPCSVAEEFYGGVDKEALLPDAEEKLSQLAQIAQQGFGSGIVRSFGEFGLDYDRLHYSTVAQQKEMFTRQLEVYKTIKHLALPLFLHVRAAYADFVEIIKPYILDGTIEKGNGVVHSFTGTAEELQMVLDLGFYVGINGCSLKTQENLDVAKLIPKEKLMIETDAPWCEIRKSHACYSMLSPYPSLFYPAQGPLEDQTVEKSQPEKSQPKKKQQANSKMDVLLPYPSIKKEQFEKHKLAVQQKAENMHEVENSEVGEFVHPLIKSRNEPVFVGFVAEVMAKLYGLTEEDEVREFVDLVYENSCRLFKME